MAGHEIDKPKETSTPAGHEAAAAREANEQYAPGTSNAAFNHARGAGGDTSAKSVPAAQASNEFIVFAGTKTGGPGGQNGSTHEFIEELNSTPQEKPKPPEEKGGPAAQNWTIPRFIEELNGTPPEKPKPPEEKGGPAAQNWTPPRFIEELNK